MIQNTSLRILSMTLLSAAILASSGCSWFRGKTVYENAAEGRSLEVPPDLDVPATDPALAIPAVSASATAAAASASRTSAASPTIVASGPFPVADTFESTWRRLGFALARVDGVEVIESAQVLGAYSVRFDGAEFLVRVSRNGETARIGAVDKDGKEVTGGAAGRLLATLRSRLG